MSNYPDDYEDDRDDRRDDEYDIGVAKSKVMAPAIGLIVVAGFSLLSALANLVQLGTIDQQFDAQVKQIEDNKQIPDAQKKEQIRIMNQIRDVMKVGMLPWLGVMALVAIITLIGGVKLMNLSSPGFVTFSAILSMLPCVSGCCLLGLVFGIWALVAMGKPEVKAGFAAKRRAAFSPDA